MADEVVKEENYSEEFQSQGTNGIAEDFTVNPGETIVSPEAPLKFYEGPKVPTLAIPVRVQKLPHYGDDIPDLAYGTEYSSGFDLYAAIEDVYLLNSIGATVFVPTGIKIEIPPGYEGQVRPRSGLSRKYGLTVTNAPGTIDADYRGEVSVLITKLTTGKFKIKRGMRIAQLVIAPVVRANIEYVDELSETDRNEGGFGSTGH